MNMWAYGSLKSIRAHSRTKTICSHQDNLFYQDFNGSDRLEHKGCLIQTIFFVFKAWLSEWKSQKNRDLNRSRWQELWILWVAALSTLLTHHRITLPWMWRQKWAIILQIVNIRKSEGGHELGCSGRICGNVWGEMNLFYSLPTTLLTDKLPVIMSICQYLQWSINPNTPPL